MKLIDRLKKDRETLDTLKTRKDKLIFLWDYYKVPIISIILVLLIGSYSLISSLTKKPVILYAVLLNSDSQIVEVESNVFIDKLSKAGIDTEGKEVDINDYLTLGMDNKESEDIETLQVLNALFTITDLDVFVGYKEDFDQFKDKDAFCDLSLLIDKQLLDKHSDDLYKYEDSSGKQIVGGIILHENSPLHKARYYHSDVIIGVASNSVYMDNALAFIRQLLSD